MKKWNQLLSILLTSTVIAACSNNASDKTLVSNAHNSSITNGKEVKFGSIYQKHTVGIYDYQDGAICTGTLLANNIVITAAHCLVNAPKNLKVIFGLDIYDLANAREVDVVQESQRQVTSFKVHPDYNEEKNYNKNTDWNDIGILKFSGKVPEGYEPAELLTEDKWITKGTEITLVGFGVSKVELNEVEYSDSKDFQEAIQWGQIMCDENNANCVEIVQTGDGPLRYTKASVYSTQETEFRLDEKQSGTCSGDSGGPAYFTNEKGQLVLAGITSRGNIMCDNQGVYTSVASFIPWIEKTIQQLR